MAATAIQGLQVPRLAAAEAATYKLDLRLGRATLLEDGGPETPIWGYNGQVPGPLLKVKRGERINVAVTNHLPQPTSVHWHGIRIDNAMDGVAELTQPAIEPEKTFDYSFIAPDAGTHWYHSHRRSWEQVARGLYGPLIVGETDPVPVDRDLVIMADDWRLQDDGQLHEKSFGNVGERAHGGRLGNVLTLNAKPYERLTVNAGEVVRLRLINAANARIMRFSLGGVAAWVVAIDGQPVESFPLGDGAVRLAPAQRVDLAFVVTAAAGTEIAISEVSGEEPLVAGYLQVETGADDVKAPVKSPFELPVNDIPAPDLESAKVVDLHMTGGAMRFMEQAIFKGKMFDGQTLAREHGQAWAFNGIAGTASEPLFKIKRGESVRIRMNNDSLWPHAMHVHGHHFLEILGKTSRKIDYSTSIVPTESLAPWRDTVLMDRDEAVEIAFVADNPGAWLLHCHMLEHSAGGMITWFEVED